MATASITQIPLTQAMGFATVSRTLVSLAADVFTGVQKAVVTANGADISAPGARVGKIDVAGAREQIAIAREGSQPDGRISYAFEEIPVRRFADVR